MALYIGCSKSNKKIKILSNVIVGWQKIKFGILGKQAMPISHVYGRFVGSSWGCDFIYQQQGNGSEFMGGERFAKLHQVVKEVKLNIPMALEIAIGQACVKREGTPYSTLQNIGIGLVGVVWLLTFTKVVINNPFTSDTNCLEEWVNLICEHTHTPFPKHVDSWLPQDFWMWLMTLPIVEREIPF